MVLFVPGRIQKIKAQGREEGQRERQQAWMAWYERQQAALRAGQFFDEPPPKVSTEKKDK